MSIILSYSIVFSIPAFAIYYVLFLVLIKKPFKIVYKKGVLALVALLEMALTFAILPMTVITLTLLYAIPLVFAGFAFRIRSKKDLSVQKFDIFILARDLNPKVPKGSQGIILEIWDNGHLEAEFLNKNNQLLIFEGIKSFTITTSDME
jgi:hypothetical protein